MTTVSAAALAVAGLGAADRASAQTVSNINALNLLSAATTLDNNATGQAILNQSLLTGVGINNNASAATRQRALVDATITSANGTILANSLGTQLGGIYQRNATASSTNDGTTITYNTFSSNVQTLFTYANGISGGDSQAGKYFYANGTTNGTTPVSAAALATLPAGGQFDVLGKAYGLPGGSAGADPYGDSRPFQTARGSYGSYQSYAGTDYFGVSTTSQAYLSGPTQNLTASPAFPSGHTTFAFTESLLFALMVPERYQQSLTRASQYGYDRVVLGAHYPLDVIAGRILATYDVAHLLANDPAYVGSTVSGVTVANFQTALASATTDMRNLLTTSCGASVATCAAGTANAAGDTFANSAQNKADYEYRLTYGLPANGPTNVAALAVSDPDAQYLLQSRFPYLTAAQRTDVLFTTEAPSGGPFDASAGFWSRLDLYTAADGYGAFNSQVAVNMDASQGGFSAADAFNNNIVGAGGLTKSGTGVLTLTGADTYTGPTIVNGGGLFVTGSIASAVTVNNTGVFGGTGTVGAVTVNGGGTLMPGTASNVGTLAVIGSLAVAANANLVVGVTPTAASSLAVKGTTTLGGGNVVVGIAGTLPVFMQISLLTATGGVTGQFATASTAYTNVNPILTYGGNAVTLTLDRTDVNLGFGAATVNQARVGAALTAAARTATNANAGAILNGVASNGQSSAALAQASLDRLSGEGLTATKNASLAAGHAFTSSIGDEQQAWRSGIAGGVAVAAPLGVTLPGGAQGYAPSTGLTFPVTKGPLVPLPAPRLWHAWGGGFGGENDIDGKQALGTARQNSTFAGGQIGVDYQAQPNWLVGVAVGGSDADFNVPNRATTGSVTGAHGAVYSSYGFANGLYLDSSLAFSGYSNDVHRTAGGVGGLVAESERASFGSFEVRVRGEVGDRLLLNGVGVTPFAAVEYANLQADAFNETNVTGGASLLGLSVLDHNTESLPVFAGLRLDSITPLGNGMALRPFVQAAYVHEFDPVRDLTNSFLSLPGTTFIVEGARPASNGAEVKAGADLAISPGVSLFANFDGEFSGVQTVYAGKGGLRVNF